MQQRDKKLKFRRGVPALMGHITGVLVMIAALATPDGFADIVIKKNPFPTIIPQQPKRDNTILKKVPKQPNNGREVRGELRDGTNRNPEMIEKMKRECDRKVEEMKIICHNGISGKVKVALEGWLRQCYARVEDALSVSPKCYENCDEVPSEDVIGEGDFANVEGMSREALARIPGCEGD